MNRVVITAYVLQLAIGVLFFGIVFALPVIGWVKTLVVLGAILLSIPLHVLMIVNGIESVRSDRQSTLFSYFLAMYALWLFGGYTLSRYLPPI
jgi:hypothetical protein